MVHSTLQYDQQQMTQFVQQKSASQTILGIVDVTNPSTGTYIVHAYIVPKTFRLGNTRSGEVTSSLEGIQKYRVTINGFATKVCLSTPRINLGITNSYGYNHIQIPPSLIDGIEEITSDQITLDQEKNILSLFFEGKKPHERMIGFIFGKRLDNVHLYKVPEEWNVMNIDSVIVKKDLRWYDVTIQGYEPRDCIGIDNRKFDAINQLCFNNNNHIKVSKFLINDIDMVSNCYFTFIL